MKLVLVTPPPVWEETLKQMNEMKGKPLLLNRTNSRYHNEYYEHTHCAYINIHTYIFDCSIYCNIVMAKAWLLKGSNVTVPHFCKVHIYVIHTYMHAYIQYMNTITPEQAFRNPF